MDRVASEVMSIIWLLFLIPSISLSTTPSSRPMASIRSLIKGVRHDRYLPLVGDGVLFVHGDQRVDHVLGTLGTELFIEMVTIDACLLATSLFTVAR